MPGYTTPESALATQPRFKLQLSIDGTTSAATAPTIDAALAVAKAFEIEHAGNPEAYATVCELDGTNGGMGTRVHNWWGGELIGPRDQRSPMEKLFRRAVQSGARVTLVDETGAWTIEADPSFVSSDGRYAVFSRAAA